MARRSRDFAAVLFMCMVLLCLTLYHLSSSDPSEFELELRIPEEIPMTSSDELPFILSNSSKTVQVSTPQLHPPTPSKITIVAIWNPGETDPIYLPNFFASVAANPTLDLLFIKYDRHNVGCSRLFAPHVPNVREVCLTFEEYWDLHATFLCDRWGGCTDHERANVVSKLHERAESDRCNSYFRPYRAAIFARWLHPATPLWGWCDMDTFLGSFARAFPWDAAPHFDVLVPALPTDDAEVLLFLPGHLAFFRHAPHVTDAFMRFPNVRTYRNFLDLPWISIEAEEAEYSHFALTQTPLTFLRFPGLVSGRYHVSLPAAGTFSVENPGYWAAATRFLDARHHAMRAAFYGALHARALAPPRARTFTDAGMEVRVALREGAYPGFVWFGRQYAVDIAVPEAMRGNGPPMRRYTMRRTPYGPVHYRAEPMTADDWFVVPPEAYTEQDPAEVGSPMLMYDSLYNHFQIEKFADWWKMPGLPEKPLAMNEVLYVDKERGAWVWDDVGEIRFSAVA